MNYTEEEASKLRCPMAFGKGLASPVRCFGSECMWWIWTEYELYYGSKMVVDDKDNPTKGKCGGCRE